MFEFIKKIEIKEKNCYLHHTFLDMRRKAFCTKPEDLGIILDNDQQVYGSIVDMGVKNGHVATMVCFIDGTASLYYSTGGGLIGSGLHENVKKAVGSYLISIHQVLPMMKKTDNFDVFPDENHHTFYLFTRSGIYTYNLDLNELHGNKESIFLFTLSQMVMNEIRIASGHKTGNHDEK